MNESSAKTQDVPTAVAHAMGRVYRMQMTTTSGGNISALDADNRLFITPAGVDKASLTAEDIVTIDAAGQVRGRHRPSSEFPFHRHIYAARPDLRAIIHAHPPGLVAYSITDRTPDPSSLTPAAAICPDIGFAAYEQPGSEALGRRIAAVFADGADSVLLENHGVVVAGRHLPDALLRFETLETLCRICLEAARLRGIGNTATRAATNTTATPSSPPSIAPTAAAHIDDELARSLCRLAQRGHERHLLVGAAVSLSARLTDRTFIVAPHGVDCATLDPTQLQCASLDRNDAPGDQRIALHRAIYQCHHDVRAIIQATPIHATAFVVSGCPLDTRTIPESYILLRAVPTITWDPPSIDAAHLASAISPGQPTALIAGQGAIAIGRTLLDAFDRMEVLEATAEALLRARALGPLKSLSDDAVGLLEQAFPA